MLEARGLRRSTSRFVSTMSNLVMVVRLLDERCDRGPGSTVRLTAQAAPLRRALVAGKQQVKGE
jgi:hypothetical protein